MKSCRTERAEGRRETACLCDRSPGVLTALLRQPSSVACFEAFYLQPRLGLLSVVAPHSLMRPSPMAPQPEQVGAECLPPVLHAHLQNLGHLLAEPAGLS